MDRARSFLLVVFSTLLLLAFPAFAAEQTGDLRGQVLGPDGPAPDAHVVVAGRSLIGIQELRSGPDGRFRFLALPPGPYDLRVEKEGFRTEVRRGVTVRLGQSTSVTVRLELPTVEGDVEVTAEAPLIDTAHTAVSQTVGRDYLDKLPMGRSYQDVIKTLPGVSGRVDYEEGGTSGGNPSVRGEGQYGNNYLLDGFSTRDPSTHTFGTNVNFDSIDEITVFTDGAPAEYGNATGMIANVVSKSGTDNFHGSVGTDFEAAFSCLPWDWGGDATAACATRKVLNTEAAAEVETLKRRFFDWTIYGTLGGPIVKKHLRFFFAFDYSRGWTQLEGSPSGEDGVPIRQTRQSHDLLGKLTWSPTQRVQLSYSFLHNGTSIDNYDSDPLVAPEAQHDYDAPDMVHNLQGKFVRSDSLLLDAKALYSSSKVDVVPASGGTGEPSYRDIATGAFYGDAQDADLNTRSRMGASFVLTKYIQRALGEHEIKAGFEYDRVKAARNIINSGGYQYITDLGTGPDGVPGTDDDGEPIAYTEYTDAGELSHVGHTMVFYLQDKWNPIPSLTIQAGARVEGIKLFQNAGNLTIDQWMAAPRLGVSWDPTRDGKTQIAFSAGRYYDAAAVDFAEWGDTRSPYAYAYYDWDRSAGDYALSYEQNPTTNPSTFAPDLRPYSADRMTLSFRREIVRDLALGLRGVISTTTGIPEDVHVDLDTFGFEIGNPESKRRNFAGLEFTVEKKMSHGLQILASYGLSASRGTTPGNFELPSGGEIGGDGNGVGLFLDTPGDPVQREAYLSSADDAWLVDGFEGMGYYHKNDDGTVTRNDEGWYGYLPYHSFHNVKVNASYTMPWETTVGLVMELDSGHAWQKRGYVDLYADYYSFPEGRGTRMMPPVFYMDIHLAQAIPIGQTELELSIDIFNLLDLQAPITYYENDDPMFGLVRFRQAPRSVKASVHFVF